VHVLQPRLAHLLVDGFVLYTVDRHDGSLRPDLPRHPVSLSGGRRPWRFVIGDDDTSDAVAVDQRLASVGLVESGRARRFGLG